MTNKERLIAFLGFSPPANTAEAALLDAGINPADAYVPGDPTAIKTVAIEVMRVIITTADTGNAEVGWTAKYDRAAILKSMEQMQEDLGLTDAGKPTITGRSAW